MGYNTYDMYLCWLYLGSFFLSFLMLIVYYESDKVKINKSILLFFISAILTNYGLSLSVFANSIFSSFVGNQLSALGHIFATYFFLVIIFELCNIHFSRLLRIPLLLFGLTISSLIISAENHHLIYESIEQVDYFGIQILNLKDGSLHFLFPLYVIIINLIGYFIVISSILSKKLISKKTSKILLFTLLTGSSVYIVSNIMHSPLSFTSVTYVLIDVLLIIISRRMALYDIASSLIDSYSEKDNIGYITFDKNFRFMSCDAFILKVFPELKNATVDNEIPRKIVFFQKKVIIPLKHWNGDEKREYTVNHGDYHLSFTIGRIFTAGKHVGYILTFRDDTTQVEKIQNMDKYTKTLKHEVRKAEAKFMEIQDNVMEGMAIMVERRDNSTGDHIKRTSACVRIFMDELSQHSEFPWCTQEFCKKMVKAAPLHDLGKIAVDDEILRKPGKYDLSDRKKMEVHPTEGCEIVHEVLKSINDDEFRTLAENVAHYHHEKWDGSGYPDHKKAEEIPIEARIMALADVFDALVSKRCYKEPIEIEKAFNIIEESLNSHFDPQLGKIFLDCKDKLREYYYTEEENYNPA